MKKVKSMKSLKTFDSKVEDSIIHGNHKKYGYFLKRLVWQKRFFVLKNCGLLYYFSKEASAKHKKTPVKIKGSHFWKSNMKRHCIHIERRSKPFLIAFDSYQEYLNWVSAFEDCGGIKTDTQFIDFLGGYKPPIVVQKVKNWKEEHILDWLSFISESEENSFSVYEKCFSSVTKGKQILNLTSVALQQMGVENIDHRNRLIRCIKQMKENKGMFDIEHYTVYQKLRRVSALRNGEGGLKVDTEHHFSKNLSHSEDIRKTFLDEKYQTLMNNESSSYFITKEEEEKEIIIDSENLHFENDYKPDDSGDIHVKIVLHESFLNCRYSTMKNFLNPVLSAPPPFQAIPFGNPLRAALLIGKTYLEWNESGIIIPKRISGDVERCFESIEPTLTFPRQKSEEIEKKISNLVNTFNSHRIYRSDAPDISEEEEGEDEEEEDIKQEEINKKSGGNRSRKNSSKDEPEKDNYSYYANCSQFLNEGLTLFGVSKPIKDNCLIYLLQKMEKYGGEIKIGGLVFTPCSGFRMKFKQAMKGKKELSFEKHKDLDFFVEECRGIDELSLMMEYKKEMNLLRDFDRMFWIRFRASQMKDVENYGPLEVEGENKCCFGDIGSGKDQSKEGT